MSRGSKVVGNQEIERGFLVEVVKIGSISGSPYDGCCKTALQDKVGPAGLCP